MTFHPKGLLFFLAFLAVLALAWNARQGHIAPAFAVAGVVAIVVVDGVLTFWPAIMGHDRRRQG